MHLFLQKKKKRKKKNAFVIFKGQRLRLLGSAIYWLEGPKRRKNIKKTRKKKNSSGVGPWGPEGR